MQPEQAEVLRLAGAHLAGLCAYERQTSFGASRVIVSDLKAPRPRCR